ncbi:cysteine desulfurase family protein [Sphingomonas sp. KC8]|uniref:cysteine desulfurase family protein n=1 Tax=Sphingomonas sp. KC8 TaxID=1030157 RepID=UPI000248BB89|nr:aminotransferase class V-fold PLP-dependent enzyme [Sphingomonas sp. KC8]ARS25944.1 cysteine desulfurase [Sphingomonas sp. KC8]
MTRIYLDHAATTPLLPQAQAAMAEALAHWANPSSPHAEGRAARAALEDARGRIRKALGWDGELIFTSGASEALAIALLRGKAAAVAASAVEHDAVRRLLDEPGLPVLADGLVDLSLVPDDALVAIQQVNNETGVVQPVDGIAAAVRAGGGLWLADCAQSAGKLALPDADFIALSAHKLGGPPGIGALLVRDLATLDAPGGQEKGYRPGTENLPAALGFAAALEARREWLGRAAELREHLEKALTAAGGIVVAAASPRLPTIGAYRMPGVPAASQLIRFDLAGIAVSAGSACSSGSVKPSHVLAAMGWAEEEAREVIRVSFGPSTTRAEIYEFIRVWTAMAADASKRAA